jgi:hypothetical protein
MHDVPLEFWSAALFAAGSTGEKMIASDKKCRWQRTVGDVVGNAAVPAAFIADYWVSYIAE